MWSASWSTSTGSAPVRATFTIVLQYTAAPEINASACRVGVPSSTAPAIIETVGLTGHYRRRYNYVEMTVERRDKQRVRGPFEATWSGTSGHRHVRVVDFSVAGCFVEDIATPAVGERVTVSLRIPGGDPIQASGRVGYVDPPQGFAVSFDEDEGVSSALLAAVRRASQQGF